MKERLIVIVCYCLLSATLFAQSDNLMLKHGLSLLGTPYVANTLERSEQEELFTNRNELDCTTFVESVMAMTLSSQQDGTFTEEDFARQLQRIRYRGGIINGYTSRLHYTTDWVNDNISKGIIEDITALHSEYIYTIRVFYMSKHPENYAHLNHNPANLAYISEIEKKLSGQRVHWIPKEKLPDEGFPWIEDGDIILFTTTIAGLDVSHLGIAYYINDKLHLLHASSSDKKVVVDSRTLRKQLERNKHITGIRVVRVIT